jgi:hypothetical protein
MEEEYKKARDKEKMREEEERLKLKEAREHEQRLQAYYDQLHEKQQQNTSQQSPNEDNFSFRTMRKRIKDINVKPTLPSIGLDEKLKKFNTRVKGFLSTNPPSFSLPIQKFRDKRNSTKPGRNLPIKLNVVDDFMKDLELQRMGEDATLDSALDSRDRLSPLSPLPPAEYDISSTTNLSPTDTHKKHNARARRRLAELRLENKSTSELQILVRALNVCEERDGLGERADLIMVYSKICKAITMLLPQHIKHALKCAQKWKRQKRC